MMQAQNDISRKTRGRAHQPQARPPAPQSQGSSGGGRQDPPSPPGLLSRPARIAVIGPPGQRVGEIAAAIIELQPDAEVSEQEFLEFCAALPQFKRPRGIVFAEVPRNPTGKIEKPKLREKYCGGSLVEAQIRGWQGAPEEVQHPRRCILRSGAYSNSLASRRLRNDSVRPDLLF